MSREIKEDKEMKENKKDEIKELKPRIFEVACPPPFDSTIWLYAVNINGKDYYGKYTPNVIIRHGSEFPSGSHGVIGVSPLTGPHGVISKEVIALKGVSPLTGARQETIWKVITGRNRNYRIIDGESENKYLEIIHLKYDIPVTSRFKLNLVPVTWPRLLPTSSPFYDEEKLIPGINSPWPFPKYPFHNQLSKDHEDKLLSQEETNKVIATLKINNSDAEWLMTLTYKGHIYTNRLPLEDEFSRHILRDVLRGDYKFHSVSRECENDRGIGLLRTRREYCIKLSLPYFDDGEFNIMNLYFLREATVLCVVS